MAPACPGVARKQWSNGTFTPAHDSLRMKTTTPRKTAKYNSIWGTFRTASVCILWHSGLKGAENVSSVRAKSLIHFLIYGSPYKASFALRWGATKMMLTQQQQLQLPPRVLLVPPQLLLDLLVDPLVLFVLRRHAAASHPSRTPASPLRSRWEMLKASGDVCSLLSLHKFRKGRRASFKPPYSS